MVRIFLMVIRIIWSIGMIGIIGVIFPHPVFDWLTYLAAFVVFDTRVWQQLGQLAGNILTKIRYRSNLPSKDNYVCKADYILPFKGKWTVYNGGVDKETSHWWGNLSMRYAYDFIVTDDRPHTCVGDNKSVHSYLAYGVDIIAPADGVVVKVSKRHKNSRVDGKKGYSDTWTLAGNVIVIKHADREYSLIAHLAPNSINVNVGDSVKQGQVIAKCGHTGNSLEPHIHFQLQSGKGLFTSVGLPIAFSNISAEQKKDYDTIDKRPHPNNLQPIGDKLYIGRGLEVENKRE